MKSEKNMKKTFKEITLITIAVILLFGGLGLVLTDDLVNGITLIGIILIGCGGAIFAYIIRDYWRSK